MTMVTIMRGVPGAGKTTWHEKEYHSDEDPGVEVVSANHFFMKNGDYVYDPTKIHEAHHVCLRQYIRLLQAEVCRRLIVDNTNISAVSIAPYISIAEAYGHDYEIVRIDPMRLSTEELANRCIHRVPWDKIHSMRQELGLSRLPRFWKRERMVHEDR